MNKCILNRNTKEYKHFTSEFIKNYQALESNFILLKDKVFEYTPYPTKINKITSLTKDITSIDYSLYVLRITFYDLFKISIVDYKEKNSIKVYPHDY